MLPIVLRALEFDRVVEAVRSFAVTPMGDARIGRLAPSPEPATVAAQLALTTEAAQFIAKQGRFTIRAADDFIEILEAVSVEHRALEPLRLLALASFLDSVWETRSTVVRSASTYPRLDAASERIASFRAEIADVRSKIDSGGEVVDSASSALRSIRDRLRKQRQRLRGALEGYLRGRDTSKYLQDQVVTERNGRYVIVVKAEHRGNISGIVHGASASGASLYLEPLSTVDINNDIVALYEQEAEEVHRILVALTEAFRVRSDELMATVEAAAELDVIQARAQFSALVDGVEPQLSVDGAFELLAARHPLLMPQVLDRLPSGAADDRPASSPRRDPVPVTIRLLPPSSVLLVTGPNTGGKTVALKTAGLLSLMAQAGLRIPVTHGSRLPVFRSVFADIGDEQSIEASLSTFSAHIANIASMDRDLQIPALVLLDEVGSGTDPVEGGALGVAIIDHLRTKGATVVATSHYDALKTYASTTEGVVCAAFGFDPDTFGPTYQLIYGTPGRSLALEIAARLGLNPAIIGRARQNVSTRDAQLADHLAKIDRDMRSLEHEQRVVAREREALRGTESQLRHREDALRQREDNSRKRLNDAIESEVRQARREIDEVIDGLKQRTERIAQGAGRLVVSTGETGQARREARAAIEAVGQRHGTSATEVPSAEPSRAPAVGDRVTVGALGLEGVVTSLHGGTVEVDVRGKRMKAAARDVRVLGGPAASTRVNVHVELQPRAGSLLDLNVIGCTVDEAISRTERFLDDSLLGDQRSFRLIHGHGTGQLRRGLTAFLKQHPLVASVQSAPPEQGGGGVTLVELKE